MMEQDNFDKLMAKICQSRSDVEKQLATTIADLKQEVTAAQEKTSNDISRKMACFRYQFKKKSHEHQFHFKSEVQATIGSARTELERVEATTAQG